MAQSDLPDARESIQQALAFLISLENLSRPGKAMLRPWQFLPARKGTQTAETNRERAETCILKIAISFAPDEPLRTHFSPQLPSAGSFLKKP